MDTAVVTYTYHTKPATLVVKPWAVYHFNWLLDLSAAGVIDQTTLGQFLADELACGSIQPCWESVPVTLTGRRTSHCVEYRMADIEGTCWGIEDDLIADVSSPYRVI